MKVLHIIDHSGLGGAQSMINRILKSKNNNRYIYCYSLRNDNENICINHKNLLCNNNKSRYSVLILFKLKRLVKKHKFDILHCHLPKSQMFGWLIKFLWFSDIKLIFHEHGQILTPKKSYIMFLKFLNSKVNIFIAISKKIRFNLNNYVGISENKIKLLYNFVDFRAFNNKCINPGIIKNKYDINDRDFVVGYAGRIIEYKGWKEFLESAEILCNRYSNIKFLIAGDGPERTLLNKSIKEKNIKDSVFYIGYIKDMNNFYKSLGCLVLPSHKEASSMVFFESQANGIPFICPNIDSIKEFAKDRENALLFKSRDSKDLAEKVEIIFNDAGLRNKLIKNGLNKIKFFSLDNYLFNLKQVYMDTYSHQ